MNYWLILYIINYTLLAIVAFTTFYLLVFSIASLFNRHTTIPRAKRQNRFLVLIPSYRKDKAILNTVSAILGQSYPQRMFDVTVISDHQSEMTNMRLAQYTITLLTPNFEKSSKLKSLQYAMLKLLEFKIYDIVLILDADNIVEPEFLEQMNDAFEFSGTKAIQAHRVPKNRDTSSARLSAIFEEINNSIFRRGLRCCLRLYLVQEQHYEGAHQWRGQGAGSHAHATAYFCRLLRQHTYLRREDARDLRLQP